jgi:hypothetical protein
MESKKVRYTMLGIKEPRLIKLKIFDPAPDIDMVKQKKELN